MAEDKTLMERLDYLPTKLLTYIVGLLVGLFAWPAFAWLRTLV